MMCVSVSAVEVKVRRNIRSFRSVFKRVKDMIKVQASLYRQYRRFFCDISQKIVVATLYQFVDLSKTQTDDLCHGLDKLMNAHDICGNIRIANEGINGTISGSRNDIDLFNKYLANFFLERKLKLESI